MCRAVVFLVLAATFPGLRAFPPMVYLPWNWGDYPECESDLVEMANAPSKGGIWALKILDASTKIPSGILTGHLIDYGNYDECFDHGGPFPTHYCLARIHVVSSRIIGNDSHEVATDLRWSYCLPASCPAKFLQEVLQEILKQEEPKATVTVTDSDCKSNHRKSLSPEDYIGISIWGIFIGFVVLATVYEVTVMRIGAKRNPWLSSFSVYSNTKNLLKTETPPDNMAPLHGLRFLSICWVLLGHRYYFTVSPSLLNLTDFAKELKKIQSEIFLDGVLAVDTFFLLSGLLNSFLLLKLLDKVNRFPVWKYYLHRYIRLTPVLAAIVLMYATWYTLLGDGPVWEQTTDIWKKLCVDHWWPTLLYINNYYNPVSQCAGQSWYLAVDMQLYWLSPLVILPLWRWPRWGRPALWVLLLLSTVGQFVVAYVEKFRMSFTLGLNQEELERVTRSLYVPTHMRATPYVIGIILGDYLHESRKKKARLILSKRLVCVGWLLSTVVALSVVLGNFQFSRPLTDHPYNRWESSFYISLHRIGWGASIGWIIIACLNGLGGFINSILSWKAFIPLSRLTYCIFLCHMAIQQYHIGTARTSDYFQHFNQIHRFFGDLLFSIFAAAGLTLIFESPILVLEKLILGKPPERSLRSEVNPGFQDDSGGTAKTHEI